jgi:hypothetical protein
MKKILIILVLLLVLPSLVSARDIYVSPGGSGSGCTLSSPCSLSRANSDAQAGDTVYLLEGTYNNQIKPSDSGEMGAYITYNAYNNALVKIETGVDIRNKKYVIVDGFEFGNSGSRWIDMEYAEHCIVRNCTMSGSLGSWSGVRMSRGNYNKLQTCEITGPGTGAPEDLVLLKYAGTHNIIEGNTIRNAAHDTLSLHWGDVHTEHQGNIHHNVVRNNYLENPYHRPYSLYKYSYRNLIEGNVFVDHDSGWNNVQFVSDDNIFRRNVIMNSPEKGLDIGLGASGTCSNNRIYFNTFYNNGAGVYCGVNSERREYFTDNLVEHSIFWSNPRDHQKCDNVDITFSINAYSSGENPKFANAPDDFSLQSTSPMIDAANFLTSTTNSGSNSQSLSVQDASYFMDGWGVIEGDVIQLEDKPGLPHRQRAQIENVDYDANTITVDAPFTWSSGQGVSLAYEGSAPDIGAFEYQEEEGPCPGECCSQGQLCQGGSFQSSSDCYYCCIGTCQDPEPTCQSQGYSCCSECALGPHSEYDADCPGQTCCESCVLLSMEYIYIEAEEGSLSSPMEIVLDSQASGGRYVHAPEGSGDTTSPTNEVTYPVNIPQSGQYHLWLLLHGPSSSNDAVYAGFNGEFERLWPNSKGQYEWVKTATTYDLQPGQNEIQLSHGEELARADVILLTDDQGFVPTIMRFHRADINPRNGCVLQGELIGFIDLWKTPSGGVVMPELMDAIGLWKQGTGCI